MLRFGQYPRNSYPQNSQPKYSVVGSELIAIIVIPETIIDDRNLGGDDYTYLHKKNKKIFGQIKTIQLGQYINAKGQIVKRIAIDGGAIKSNDNKMLMNLIYIIDEFIENDII